MKELVEKVAKVIAPCGNNVMDMCPTPCPHCTEDAGLAIKAVLEHFSKPGNVTEAMGIAWVKAMDWDEPSSADTISAAMRAALEEFKQ